MSFIRAIPIRLLPFAAMLMTVPGCAGYDDPFQRDGTWHAQNINEANLAAMVSDRRHLAAGVGDDASPGAISAQAVQRLLTDHVKPLPSTQIGPLSSSAQSGSGGS
jgi:hypothetical protein